MAKTRADFEETTQHLEMTKKQKRNERKSKQIDSRPFAEISQFKLVQRSKRKKRLNRSKAGDLFLFLFLAGAGIISFLPMLLIVSNAFKPLNEIFEYPPKFIVQNPTLDNFRDLGVVLGTSLVPFSRYFFNTILVTVLGTVGHLIIASMCAYPLAKYKIPGGTFIMGLVTYSLMFPAAVRAIPNYIVLNSLGLINTYWSIVLPVIASSLGLYLMKQFMEGVPTELLESAKIDGASEFKIYRSIVMPLVKPASLTLIILNFQNLWAADGSTYIYREDFKMLSYALNQIASAGPARQGTLAAVSLIMVIVPVVMFIVSQSSMLDTMAHSGMK
jgi:ABC-type glycerol-3-phosphate transport system permease component